ncbi:DUF1643 domain-containing protein [Streptomyces actinomycinicus]|uniref:DUF1643 domain-containing protein n=1 Tax=Streptomyces actinomycinicus TaxID=1695166 RepID=A0A937ERR5_9ACTN|nr:DUF1643 domain-containing protein [Streptomyces actinomycinicus]MBL1086824.1 DUF1643 domain-containing protein [Streptomyces actinomycinicus]
MTTTRKRTRDILRTAALSSCGTYRYLLVREWARSGRTAVFVLLNPSTADADRDDATTRRCINYAQDWGCSSVWIVNLYAFRARHPADLWTDRDPVGPENDRFLRTAAAVAADTGGPLVAGWGTEARPERISAVLNLPGLEMPSALAVTQYGQPHHPLRLDGALTPKPWTPPGTPVFPVTTRRTEPLEPLDVVLNRPGLPDLRLGPYYHPHVARGVATGLRQQMHSTQHVPGTVVTVQPHRGADHLEARVPTDSAVLADLMDDNPPGDGTGRDFPDLYARLYAQEGYERASELWSKACKAWEFSHSGDLDA